MKKILNFGSLNLDHVYSVPHFVSAGETISSGNLTVNCGGKGLNQSIAAAKAGADVYHAGKIGADGDSLVKILEENGVNTEYLKKGAGPNGHAIIQVDTNGQNCILLFAGSNHEITTEEIDETLRHFDADDYLILQNEINNIPYIMNRAKEKGMKIVFNPSPITDELLNYPISTVSLLVLNEIEGAALSGTEDKEKMVEELRKRFQTTDILLSLGKDGAVYYDGNEEIKYGIYRTNVVDTTAAGDTVLGYFVASIASGMTAKKALERASKAAAITISRFGAGGSIPTADEVDNCILDYIG